VDIGAYYPGMNATKYAQAYQNAKRGEIVFSLRETLDQKGLNFSTFGRKHGFDPKLVNVVAWVYWQTDEVPNGLKMWRILQKLHEEFGLKPPERNRKTAGDEAC
jgi:hypothetical protein